MSNLEMNMNLKYSWFETNANINKLPPEWIILIGLLLAGYGFYLYSKKDKKENNCK